MMESGADADSLVPPAVDTLPINIAILDDTGTILWTNQAWRKFGAANDIAVRPDTVGVNYLDVTAAADDDTAQRAATGLEAVLAGDTDAFELEYPCHSPEEKRWFLMRAAAFTVQGQRYVAVAHIDVTERVRSERETELFKRVVETAGHVVLITDREGVITYVNPAFEDVTGYAASEALGQTPRLLKSGEHDPAFYEDMWTTITAGNEWEGTIVNRRKSGALYYAHQTIAPIRTDDGEITQFVALQTEITELEEMRQQLQAHDDILRHDLRTQLTVIRQHADALGEESDADAGGREGDDPVTDHVDAIIEATDRLLSTAAKTRALQTFLEQTTEPEPVDVVRIVEEVVTTQRDRFPDATIVSDTPSAVDALGVAEIDRALTELVENSITHSDRPTPWVCIEVRDTADFVEVAVADDGPGIPPMEYETFTDDVPTQLIHRTEIGLDMVYWIARRSGGQLHVDDRDPRGSVVTLRLPSASEAETYH